MNLVIQAIKCASRKKIVVILIFVIVTRSNVYGSLSKLVDSRCIYKSLKIVGMTTIIVKQTLKNVWQGLSDFFIMFFNLSY